MAPLKKLRTLIVDDEILFRQVLKALLAAHDFIEIIGEAESTSEAIDRVFHLKPDLVFLDVRMPGETGFELLPHLLPSTQVVFVTSSEKYAVDAIDVRAAGYLVKPVSPTRLATTLHRIKENLAPKSALPLTPSSVGGLAVHTDGELVVIHPEEISWIESEGNYTRVHRLNHPSVLTRRTLKKWKEILPVGFSRINRTVIIRTQAVARVQLQSREKGALTLLGQKKLLILGRRSLQKLKKSLGF